MKDYGSAFPSGFLVVGLVLITQGMLPGGFYIEIVPLLMDFARAHRPVWAVFLAILVITLWYRFTKLSSKCYECGNEFAIRVDTVRYPSQGSFDKDGNWHERKELDQKCVYCNSEDEDAADGFDAPLAADGGRRR